MDKIDLNELERLAAQATPGPWELGNWVNCVLHTNPAEYRRTFFIPGQPALSCSPQDAAYIVAACNAAPELIARVRELERQRGFFISALKENNLCPAKGRCWPDGSELEEWDCSAANNRECWIQAAKEAGK